MQPGDAGRRLAFAQWFVSLPQDERMNLAMSDEAYFSMCGDVNSKNVVRYSKLKSHGGEGRPEQFFLPKQKFPKKLMVFAGLYGKTGSSFGLTFYGENCDEKTQDKEAYSRVLYKSIGELRAENGGTLAGIKFVQDGATTHTANCNLQILDDAFGMLFL